MWSRSSNGGTAPERGEMARRSGRERMKLQRVQSAKIICNQFLTNYYVLRSMKTNLRQRARMRERGGMKRR
jgi:hypothetical protein